MTKSAATSPLGTSHFTRVNGLQTHAWVRGDGPPLVLVPGLGCASWMYVRVSRELARERTVYVYDPPGHGFSKGRRDYPRNMEDLTDHLAEWLVECGLNCAPLFGHSLGGEVIFDLAARYPTCTSALIACAPTGIPENPSVTMQLLRLLRDLPRERLPLLLPALSAYSTSGFGLMLRLASDQSQHDTGPLLPAVQVPTLLLDGDADPVIQSWTVREIRRAIPGAVVRTVPGGTHALTDSHPKTVARYTLDFLRRVEAGQSQEPAALCEP
ncbi:alpha/beta hydrolase [Deinococcus puniceus]|uniref:Alpha/beta hydrolase n=1 Tax=Deinococcus puniceus TaxID=1182568 RepID=A0A172T9A0_9DEIO|nr:alpha/beta hydrolase [Deinococcus puniceus]